MIFSRLARIPKRVADDLKIVRLAKNWREILAVKLTQEPLRYIILRNGVVLRSPEQVSLNFLFHEIWVDEVYAPPGYEINDGDVVVDIGANIGVFAMYAATRAKGVDVWSFEPFPKNAEYFRENLRSSNLNNIHLYQVAVGGSEGRRVLHVDNAWILHSLTEEGSDEDGLEVECITLDRLFGKIEVCDLLKMDCEGSEYEILYSAADETISKIRRIVCEFNNADSEVRNGIALREFLISKGFSIDPSGPLDGESGFLCARRRAA